MTITLLLWAFGALVFYLAWRGFVKKPRFWSFGPYTSLVYSFIVLIAFVFAVEMMANSPKYTTPVEQLRKRVEANDLDGVVRLLSERSLRDELDIATGKLLVDAYLMVPETDAYDSLLHKREVYLSQLVALTVQGSSCHQAHARHLLAYYHFSKGNLPLAKHLVSEPIQCFSEGYYTLKARIIRTAGSNGDVWDLIVKSIEEDQLPGPAFDLALQYYGSDEVRVLQLARQPKALRHMEFGRYRLAFLKAGQWWRYARGLYFGILFRYHPFYVFISFLIVASIGLYLYSIDVFDRDSLVRLVTCFLIGCAVVPLSLLVYDLYPFGLGWYKFLADSNLFAKMVLLVGMNEELIKSVVLLAAVYGLRWANEPIDYIIYASIGALAFAFLENTMYFDRYDGNVVFARTIFSTMGHVFFSSWIGYGLAVNRFRWRNKLPFALLFPLLWVSAALWHGVYNTLLQIGGGMIGYLFIIPYFLIIMSLLGGFLNNSMNNSPHFNQQKVGSNDGGINHIATSFILLFIVQQCILLYVGRDFDPVAEKMSLSALLMGHLVALIAYFLGAFDVVKGYWISPWQMLTKRKVDRNVGLGLNCELHVNKPGELVYPFEYLVGNITGRITIEGDNAFFVIVLATPYVFQGQEFDKVVVRHVGFRHRILSGVDMPVRCIVPLTDPTAGPFTERTGFRYIGVARLSCPQGLQGFRLQDILSSQW
ncbi:MAG: PrsW family intramembrane metalloprotease [Bacteroidetes bacterium]|nr:PrsW family intramembrane metalloprotease [Bacteroidota bacterium]